MKIIIIASASDSTNILYNSLSKKFNIQNVFIEKKIGKLSFLKTRFKKVGFFRLIDQVIFIFLLYKLLRIFSKNRINYLLKFYDLSNSEIPSNIVKNIDSINSDSSIDLIKKSKPDIIIVSGTRIISSRLINSSKAKIINIHAGITPKYRGVHGAYWAIANNDLNNIGVTLHFVDKGVDTGEVISQSNIKIDVNDNFSTYSLIQLSKGIDLLINFLKSNGLKKSNNSFNSSDKSKQWYHPGFFEYLFNFLFYGHK